VEEQRGQLKELVEHAAKAADDAEAEVKTMEASSTPLPSKAKAVTSTEGLALADEAAEKIQQAKDSAAKAKSEIADLKTDVNELKHFLSAEIGKLVKKTATFDQRVTRATSIVSKVRDEAAKKEQAEIEATRKVALEMIRHHQAEKRLNVEKLYAEFDTKNDDRVDETEFVSFFKKCAKKEEGASPEPSEEDLSKLYGALDEDSEGAIPKDTFFAFIRLYMKVVKETVATEGVDIKGSKTVRRLELNEVCEVIDGPVVLEEGVNLTRIQIKMLKDSVVGWCTPVGNQGSVFLEENALQLKVVKETIMTPTFEIAASKETTKKLKVGEIVEVREWMKKEEESGLMRAKVKSKDGKMGWATAVGNAGNVFLELV